MRSSKEGQKKPVHGTAEWAGSKVNIQNGCEHDCKYCYAKSMAIRTRREAPESWGITVLNLEALDKGFRRRNRRIMFPTSHDITPGNIEPCIGSLECMMEVGNKVLIVSKPHLGCVEEMCRRLRGRKGQILFRFTIGSVDNGILKFWEPHAPAFEERLAALRHAHRARFKTSVSCEPMLDDNIHAVIASVEPYVTDTIWLGKANRLRHIISLNCPEDIEVARKADELIAMQSDERIRALYEQFKDNPKIRWKNSIKKVLGLERPTEKGLDI